MFRCGKLKTGNTCIEPPFFWGFLTKEVREALKADYLVPAI